MDIEQQVTQWMLANWMDFMDHYPHPELNTRRLAEAASDQFRLGRAVVVTWSADPVWVAPRQVYDLAEGVKQRLAHTGRLASYNDGWAEAMTEREYCDFDLA